MMTAIEDVAERTLNRAGARAAALAEDVWGPHAAETVSEATHRAVHQLRHGALRASDVMDEAALCIRRQPLKAVSVSFAGGVVAGLLAAATVIVIRRA